MSNSNRLLLYKSGVSKSLGSEGGWDRKKNINDFWYGQQWRPEEFEELVAPHVEKVLKHLGVLE